MGAEVSELYGAQPGYIRAYNIRNGKLEWTFHTIPLPGEPGYETWPKDAYKYAGGVNDWAGMSVDTKRGMVFLALGSPSYDFYGADRKGKICTAIVWWHFDAKTGNTSGITNSFTMIYGTTTCPHLRIWSRLSAAAKK
jgi:quinoprotein glucose dehydrogenase